MAVANYHDAHGHYPPAYLADANGRPIHSWRVLLLPYIEQKDLYDQYDFSEPWDGPKNRQLAERMPAIYAFHGESRPGVVETNYLAVVGPETVWPGRDRVSSKDVVDGLSSTILIVENLGARVHWMEPRDLPFGRMSFKVDSPEGVSSKYLDPAVVMLDGSLHTLRKDLREGTLRALLTTRGGEKVQEKDQGWVLLPDGRDRPPAVPPGRAER